MLEATVKAAFVKGGGGGGGGGASAGGDDANDVHLEVVAAEGEGEGGKVVVRVEVRSTDGDTLPDLAPKARSLVDGMEGEVARTNRRWRRMQAKQAAASGGAMET